MKRLPVALFCLTAALGCFALPVFSGKAFAFSSRSDPDRVMRKAELMRQQGKYPVSLSCRAGKAEGPFAPVVKVEWQDNTHDVEWEMFVYKGQLEKTPGFYSDWKRIVRIVNPTASDRFYCLLYYKR